VPAPDTVAPLSTEQQAKIQERLRGEKDERLTKMPFPISIGEAVPRTFHFYRLRLGSWNTFRNIAIMIISWSAMRFGSANSTTHRMVEPEPGACTMVRLIKTGRHSLPP
jgi:hypothetical protein